MIFWVPTPFATPSHRLSTSLIMLHLWAQAALIIVICAPESTKAKKKKQRLADKTAKAFFIVTVKAKKLFAMTIFIKSRLFSNAP